MPEFRAGDTLKVHVKVVEGNRSRVQVFQGVCIRVQGSGVGRTFTVRKVSFGVGVERTFPLHTPIIDKIEVVTRGDVRRAKLYYLRNLRGKAAKIKEKRDVSPSPLSSTVVVDRADRLSRVTRPPDRRRRHAGSGRRGRHPAGDADEASAGDAPGDGERCRSGRRWSCCSASRWCWRSSSRPSSCRPSTSRRRR